MATRHVMSAMAEIMRTDTPYGDEGPVGMHLFHYGESAYEPAGVAVHVRRASYGATQGYTLEVGSYSHRANTPTEALAWAALWQAAAAFAYQLRAELDAHPEWIG
jgi:hypothetical protein